MGVMARKSGEDFIITSDSVAGEAASHRAPKRRANETYQVWTGTGWSANATDAKTFPAIDAADEYVRANYAKVMGVPGTPVSAGRWAPVKTSEAAPQSSGHIPCAVAVPVPILPT